MIKTGHENVDGRRPLKIAYIVSAFPHASETFIVNQIAGIAARGHVVDIFITSDGEMDNVPSMVKRYDLMKRTYRLYAGKSYVIRVLKVLGLLITQGWRAPEIVMCVMGAIRHGGGSGSLRLFYAALTLIRLGKRRYDVIHAQFGTYGLFALDLVEVGALSGAIVTSFRGYDATQYLKANTKVYRELFRRGALFLPVSLTLAQRLIEAGCDPAKVQVHHSGIESGKLPYVVRDSQKQGCTSIITVARLVEKKGLQYAIQAIARVIASGRTVHYIIVGEGPLRGELERLIDKLGVAEHVTLTGWKSYDETLRLVQESHIMVAPSVTAADGDEEGIPNSVKEAMAMGLPVIATRHGGIPELVEDGLSGYLVPERDAEALAEGLKTLINNPESWAAMGSEGRRCVEAEFDIDKLDDELVELYRSIAEVGAPTPHISVNKRSEPGAPATGDERLSSSGLTRKAQGD